LRVAGKFSKPLVNGNVERDTVLGGPLAHKQDELELPSIDLDFFRDGKF